MQSGIEWVGTERYEVRGCLGRGGMGVVYEVLDRESDRLVAAKRLLHFDPSALYLFKQEFRTLAGVHHPNLVRFYDLVQRESGDAFFTMELVPGVDFHRYSQGALKDPTRLRAALRQLVEGIRALHAAGKLHRDIKPSNVLVTEAGRVVLLDFGVATELSMRTNPQLTPSGELVGSAIYMAPEQADEEPPGAASDWYSVGVMLYEVLVGRPPFSGTVAEVLTRKITTDPSAPSTLVAGVPADLDALCMALLHRDPALRPSGAEIARRLGGSRSVAPPAAGSEGAMFIGRAPQLEALSSAFDASRQGLVVVRVGGTQGMGKFALVQRFVERVEREAGAVVLRGRVHERESVPYKAIDGMVDALSAHLVALDLRGDPLELPDDVWALARLFPVLRRVPGVAELAEPPIVDPPAVRSRAIVALRALLAALAARAPLVVFIDDVHWGDVDSANLLLDLVRPPDAPPVLLVMTYREAEAEESPFWTSLRERWPAGAAARDLVVGPLDAAESEALALSLLGDTDPHSQRIAHAIARESRGAPFLVAELARSNRDSRSSTDATLGMLSLEQMVSGRLERLTADARRVLDAVAVGGRPMRASVIAAACELASADETVAILVARRLARTAFRGGFEVVEASHDRIRETVIAQLGADAVARTHGKLARVLATTSGADAEEVADHWLAGGDRARAAEFVERAAEHAASTFAFDRAARLFRRTLELLPATSPDIRRCQMRLAEALKYAGRTEESARAYIAAAEGADPGMRVDLRREAAHQLLAGGHLEKAGEVLHDVLAAVGMRAPRSLLAALFWLVIYSVWSRVLGLRVRELLPDDVPTTRRLRVDALYTVVGGFSLVDPVLGACMQARHFIEVHRGVDAYRVVRALGLEAAHAASAGKPETARERTLVAAGRSIAERPGGQAGQMFFNHILGLIAFQRSRWAEAQLRLGQNIDAYPYGQPGLAIIRIYSLLTDFYATDLATTIRRSRKLLAQADERGDLYTSVNLRATSLAAAFLAEDDPEAARASIHLALAQWPKRFSVQHWHAMIYEAHVDLYSGLGSAAYARCRSQWPALERSFIVRSVSARIPAFYLRAQVAIASIGDDPRVATDRIAEARRFVRLLEKECDPLAEVLAPLGHAIANNAAGDEAGAIAQLRIAIERGEATGTRVYVAPARHRLGLLLGGEAGRTMVAEATAELAAQGIRNPARWAGVHAPGSWAKRATAAIE